MQENCRVLLNEKSYESDSLSFYKPSMGHQTHTGQEEYSYVCTDGYIEFPQKTV